MEKKTALRTLRKALQVIHDQSEFTAHMGLLMSGGECKDLISQHAQRIMELEINCVLKRLNLTPAEVETYLNECLKKEAAHLKDTPWDNVPQAHGDLMLFCDLVDPCRPY